MLATAVTRQSVGRYRDNRAAEKRLHRRKKRQHWERILAEAEGCFSRYDARSFYKKVNGIRNRSVSAPVMCNDWEGNLITDKTEVARRWKEHFSVLLKGEGNSGVERSRMAIENDGQAVDPLSMDEVKKAVKELRNCKAAGKDGIPAELFKVGSEQLYRAIHRIMLRVWSDEELPSDWLEGLICPIYKKGHRLDCSNYRGITVLKTVYKILSRILFHRLRPLQESFVGENQCGFRGGRSTTDQMFSLRKILDKFREFDLQTHQANRRALGVRKWCLAQTHEP
ncbi:uncharacterized protein LOC129732371 [Wyeomyia smithii]|uniref:uncharacterized protein LOC129732371 n=1 Tax=Wyeomyia smithii TaxID=174621 RepID=UPI002467F166|nr:uncharacterized protein LOC129732371 [Wyeomyia smithii]